MYNSAYILILKVRQLKWAQFSCLKMQRTQHLNNIISISEKQHIYLYINIIYTESDI